MKQDHLQNIRLGNKICPQIFVLRSNKSFKNKNISQQFTYKFYIDLPTPPARAGYDTRLIFKQSLTGFNSEFSFPKNSCLTKAEKPSLPYYLSIAGGRIIGFIPFPRVLVLCEMLSVLSRI